MAAAVGPQDRITGLDIAPEFLAKAKDNVKYKGLTDRVTFCQSDIYDPPFENEEFNWIWSANCACYAVRQPLQLLQGFRRTLKPGGLLLLLIWSSQQLLPGYPRLEALLNATTPGIAPFKKDAKHECHCL